MKSDIILLGHGSGGKLSHELLDDLIVPILSGIGQRDQNDAAVLTQQQGRLAFTTDSYVVDPIFFPGGSIGSLAIHGTINDLAMAAAMPIGISVGLIIEEGLAVSTLRTILEDMSAAAEKSGVRILTGDTKVVPRGKVDKIFINTSGIGVMEHDLDISGHNARVGDKILINGTIGDHGMAVMASREGLALDSDITSDSAPLNSLVADLIHGVGGQLHALRDPTRGGVATTLKEIAIQSEVEITLRENSLPVGSTVAAACSILGLDPLFVANEGKLLAFIAPEAAEQALMIMRSHEFGKRAAIIGEVTSTNKGKVRLQTTIGGLRAIEMLAGEQLPRIC
ncbi:MAG: hydrogenase expression/formation protein HypE [Deltaproteobacteria bacterium]|jgi:hydrogenase expression/formation protein HypE|nr:hydrogenase expression/formation protein HypE [Deltaproteobacteria bacterium]MBW2512185.1 hydrogenase expression/formation protein HypE [Deltaproteobacteria bacterium]